MKKKRNKTPKELKKINSWDDKLPNTSNWLPRNIGNIVGESFAKRCKQICKRIIRDVEDEIEFNINNFDSGFGVEDIVRREISALCPRRYSVSAATIIDRNGNSAGDFDIVISDDFWTPILKTGATSVSRKAYLPIEAIYGVIEVKQTIDFKVLDNAIEKLVTCKRLERPTLPGLRVTENIDLNLQLKIGDDDYEAIALEDRPNPLYSSIIAVKLNKEITINNLMRRFVEINKKLKRSEVIQSLCVLDSGCVFWGWIDNDGSTAALFKNDLNRIIYPCINFVEKGYDPFYPFASLLLKHLFISTLACHELPMIYGPKKMSAQIFVPPQGENFLLPDAGQPEMTEYEKEFLKQYYKVEVRHKSSD